MTTTEIDDDELRQRVSEVTEFIDHMLDTAGWDDMAKAVYRIPSPAEAYDRIRSILHDCHHKHPFMETWCTGPVGHDDDYHRDDKGETWRPLAGWEEKLLGATE